jgi:hypothetical protein
MKGRPFGLLVPPGGVGTPKLQTFFFPLVVLDYNNWSI